MNVLILVILVSISSVKASCFQDFVALFPYAKSAYVAGEKNKLSSAPDLEVLTSYTKSILSEIPQFYKDGVNLDAQLKVVAPNTINVQVASGKNFEIRVEESNFFINGKKWSYSSGGIEKQLVSFIDFAYKNLDEETAHILSKNQKRVLKVMSSLVLAGGVSYSISYEVCWNMYEKTPEERKNCAIDTAFVLPLIVISGVLLIL